MPEPIGGAVYKLDLDRGTFSTGIKQSEQELSKLKSTGDAVTKSNAGMGASLGGIGRTAAAVALGMGGLNIAVTGVQAALRGTIAAAAADAASQARLQAAVAATGAAYADYADQLDKVIKKGQQRGFSDDQTRSALSILIAQTDSVTEATKRYAIAQDLARGANIDVVTASRLLGKITEDNVTALQRYGVTVKKGASETEALAQIQQKFSGQAEAFANSTAGQFERTSDAISEAGESIGRVLLPGVAAASEAIAAGAQNVEKFATKLEGAGDVGATLFPSLTTGAGAFAVALGAVKISEFVAGIAAAVRQEQALRQALNTGLVGGARVQQPSIASNIVGKLATPQAAIIGTTVAVVALDAAVRHFTGGGIIEFLTGETAAHDRAAEAARRQGDAVADLAQLATLGVGPEAAGRLEVAAIIDKATDAQKRFNDEVERLRKIQEEQGPPTAVPFATGTPIPGQQPGLPPAAVNAKALFNAEIDQAARNLRDTLASGKIGIEEFRTAASNPVFGDRFKSDLTSTDALLRTINADVAAVADTFRTARSEFNKELKIGLGDLDQLDPVVENLKVQLLLLEEAKRRLEALGDTAGVKAIDAQMASLHNTIESLGAPTAIAAQRLQAFGAALLDAAGGSIDAIDRAKETFAAFVDSLAGLTRQERIDIEMKLPLDNMTKLQQFIDLVKENSSLGIDVAVRIATAVVTQTPAQQFPGDSSQFLGGNLGDLPGAAAEKAKAVANALGSLAREATDAEKATNDASRGAGNAAGAFADAGGAAADAAKQTAIWSDGIIDLSEAIAEGLSAAQVAALENTHDAELAADGLADAQFRLAVAQEKAAMGSDSLQIALVQIATELINSKRTAEEFKLAEWLRPAFDEVHSMIDEIFSKPTKEGLALDLKKAQLERKALLLEQGGADASNVGRKGTKKDPAPAASAKDRELKAVNDQIAALDREISLRQKDFEIAKLQTELKDQTLQTDADLLNANQFLGDALSSLSGSVKNTEDALGIRLFDAALHAASALQAVQAAGGTGFTAAEKHWINQVAINAGEAPPFPGFAKGTLGAAATGMALIHQGEPVLPASVGGMFRDLVKLYEREPAPRWDTGMQMPSAMQRGPMRTTPAGESGTRDGISIVIHNAPGDDEATVQRVAAATRRALRRSRGAGAAASPSAYRP